MDIQDAKNWNEYDITHPLTDKGLAKFAADWRSIFTSNDTE